ncbi:MAG TPA: M28 family peptidase [Polyangiaceae bacterium]|nr:M28 family peptidase [Polyangiaceae bacterium]
MTSAVSWRFIVSTLGVLPLACSDPVTLDGFDASGTSRVTEQIESARIEHDVNQLYSSHRADRPIDCGSICDANPLVPSLSHDATRQLLRERLQLLRLPWTEQQLDQPVGLVNLYVDLPGATEPEEVVLVAAHYDAYFGGADDNSTGVAALLELARVLPSFRFARTVRLAFFDLEELGCRGATLYTQRVALERHRIVFVLDSLGSRHTGAGSQPAEFGVPWPSSADFLLVQANSAVARQAAQLELLNRTLRLTRLFTIVAPADGAYPLTTGLLNGDQIPFWLAHVPTVNFSDTPCCREHRMHTERDVPEALDPAFLTENTRFTAAAVAYFAGVLADAP